MRRSFKLQDLGCANCAAKMEHDINKLDGVNKATISFMTQKLLLDADDEQFEAILDECQRICNRYEEEVHIIRK